ncbi:sugar phosphate isomerase/epimerase [Thermatribacter velox]|uniref:Sugar phosphate isomerase/epimerase n=1 Tax=Thermatribacter velox TaxID=3039681 RepID=A0ABZ2Y9X6_9BACT
MFSFLAVSTNTYHGFSLSEALSGIARAGFKFVELACVKGWTNHFDLESYSKEDLEGLKKELNSFGLQVISLSAHSDLASSDGVAYLQKTLHFAHLMGAKVVNTGTIENEKDTEAFLNNIQVLAKDAEAVGVQIGLEIHGDFFKSGEVAREIVREIGSPFVGINYDTGNAIFYGNVRPEEDIALCFPWLVHIHLKDKRGGYKVWDFPALGRGEVNFGKILGSLPPEKHSIPLSVEIEFDGKFDHPKEFVDQAVQESFTYLMRLQELFGSS